MSAPIVNAPCGSVSGIERPNSLAFLGIPYAEAPVGELRFQAPRPRSRWEGVREATEFGATPQRRPMYDDPTIPEPIIPGEDTLNLNVFTPTSAGDAGLPVLVYIHGGGYVAGSHVGSWFDGSTYNVDGVVVVTISYRLGFDGFGWIADAPRNRGLLDMVCALEWVRDNIGAFGGDPTRVTISGQSAGGGAVLALMSMPAAQGLFHRVIAHSPVIGVRSVVQHEANGREFAALAGVDPTLAGWTSLEEAQVLEVQFAQAMAPFDLHPMAKALASEPEALCEIAMGWGPAMDPATLPVPPYQAWAEGFAGSVDLLVGATADEFLMPPMAPPSDAVRAWLDTIGFEPRLRAYALQLLDDGVPDPVGRLATTVLFRRNVLRIAAARRAGGARVWLYDFQQASSVTGLSGHCLELPFTWNCLADAHAVNKLGEDQPQALADEMHAAWVGFIAAGEPGWPEGTGRVFGGSEQGVPAFADVAALA